MIPLFKPHMPRQIMEPLEEVLFSGFVGEGPKVKEFEEEFGKFIECPNVLALNSGTSSIQLALRLSGVGPGDEVITTPMTCVATNQTILAAGADIVWADTEKDTGNILPGAILEKITERTKAIIVVHWGGLAADLEEIDAIAEKFDVKVIEDAAHALGSTYQGIVIGNHSDFVCFSFQAIKVITTIDGGALVCKSAKDLERGRKLRWYGLDRDVSFGHSRMEQDITEWGYKFHMNDVAATIGLEQLKVLPKLVAQRQEQAMFYHQQFHSLPGIGVPRLVTDRASSFWLYALQVSDAEAFLSHMDALGIMVSKVHRRNDQYTVFEAYSCDLPNLDHYYERLICIPIGHWLGQKELEYIAKGVRAFALR